MAYASDQGKQKRAEFASAGERAALYSSDLTLRAFLLKRFHILFCLLFKVVITYRNSDGRNGQSFNESEPEYGTGKGNHPIRKMIAIGNFLLPAPGLVIILQTLSGFIGRLFWQSGQAARAESQRSNAKGFLPVEHSGMDESSRIQVHPLFGG